MRLEFLICGSPNDSFYSQTAMFRLALDSFGGFYRQARLVLCLADLEHPPLPERWHPHFERIEIHWADRDSFLAHGDGSDYVFGLIDDHADLTFICDADTLMLRPFPADFLSGLVDSPAIAGVLAHRTPPRTDALGHDYRRLTSEQFWSLMAQEALGREFPLAFAHPLSEQPDPCPFYINYGFVAGTPKLLKALHAQLDVVQPLVRKVLDNEFYGQIGIALAVERGQLPVRSLPMRFNFPNDPRAFARYPGELEEAIVMHYLFKKHFDRHVIFATEGGFYQFLSLSLTDSDARFQQSVACLTGGKYPFT